MSVFARTLPEGRAPSVSPAQGNLKAVSWAEAWCKQAFHSFKECCYFSKETVIDFFKRKEKVEKGWSCCSGSP